MSTDYSKMSDFEINCMIAKIFHTNFEQGGLSFLNDGSVRLYGYDRCFDFNPCNNPADAWSIIVDNKISIHHFVCKYEASSIVFDKKYKDGFFIFSQHSDVGDISSRAALRAAMIVFLMMQESKNAS